MNHEQWLESKCGVDTPPEKVWVQNMNTSFSAFLIDNNS